MKFHERLLPHWWVIAVVAIPLTMLAVAYGSAYGSGTGLAVGLCGAVIAGWLLWISSPVITVDPEFLRAGGARLPMSCVGDADLVDRAQIRTLRGPGADARVFVVLRPWSARDGVLVNLDDEQDPHPAWLISSRHPQRLLDALAADGR